MVNLEKRIEPTRTSERVDMCAADSAIKDTAPNVNLGSIFTSDVQREPRSISAYVAKIIRYFSTCKDKDHQTGSYHPSRYDDTC